MFEIPVYKAELDVGLGELIRSTARVAMASKVSLAEKFDLTEVGRAKLKSYFGGRAKAGVGDLDLHYLTDILVTTGWNKNTDVFDGAETWMAKATPVYKPFNYEHVGSDIIGTTIAARVIDAEGKVIADDTAMDALPAKFHILNEDVIYKVWEDQKLQERMDRTLAEIAKGEWFVSMECLFKNFDYALLGPNGQGRVVARNTQTAFLTKHLKAYGGDGVYGDCQVGRLFRNIVFSGKGLVRNPANPESVILGDTKEFSTSTAELTTDFSRLSAGQVYSSSETVQVPSQKESESTMAIEIETLQKKLDAAIAENESLKAAQRDNDVKVVAAAKEKAEAQVAELAKKVEEAAKASEAHKATLVQLEESKKALEDSQKALAEVKDELKSIFTEQKKADRLAKVKSALKVDSTKPEDVADAVTLAEAMFDLPEDKFEAQLKVIAKFTPAPLPEKNTPAPVPEKKTPAPLPTGKASEEHDANEGNADPNALEAAKVEKGQAALSTVQADDGVSDLAKDVADFFGCKAE